MGVNFEPALISALSTLSTLSIVVTALGSLYRQLSSRSETCEQWRDHQEPVILDLREKVGALSAAAAFAQGCKTEGCPFSGQAATFSLQTSKP